ncbi:MAG: 1,2-phenylacetyl-CoA epoxidase subunit PaaD [Catalinimonas sp.]
MIDTGTTQQDILDWLQAVKDPEIPTVSLVDLGVIVGVHVDETHVRVEMTPTFAGCPALDHMRREVEQTLRAHGVAAPEVVVTYDQPWTSDRINARGRAALQSFGLAPPPPAGGLMLDLDVLEHVPCPHCSSDNTVMRSPFGPTLCRSLHRCDNCGEAFEQFKPL